MRPTGQEREHVKVHLATALAEHRQGSGVTEREVERLIDSDEGTDNHDPAHDNAWCRITARDIPHDIYVERGVATIPAGVSTEAPYILPQHHDQAWVDEVLCPLIAPCLVEEARKRPDALDAPLWAFTIASLAPYWAASPIQALWKPTASGRALIYVPTLRRAIELLRDAGFI